MTGESFYDFSRFIRHKTDVHNQARFAQFFNASSGNPGIRIGKRHHNTPYTGLNQPVCTRAGSSMMRTWLKRYINGRAARGVTSFIERNYFGVIAQGIFMAPAPGYSSVFNNDAAHTRIGAHQSGAFFRKAESLFHEFAIVPGH
jgi:hypothetical protein